MSIISIEDLRDMNKISNLCNETNEPILITKNGYVDMVIMSIKTFENKFEKIEMFEAIFDDAEEDKQRRYQFIKGVKIKYDLGQ